jgi:hypothetical protein
MIKTLSLAALLLMLSPLTARALGLDDILEHNARAHGGAKNFAWIQNIRYQLTISEPGFVVSGTYVATRQGDMRIDIEADGRRVFSEGLQQGRAWQWTPDGGVEEQDEQAAAALRHGIELPGRFFTFQDARANGANITLEGTVADGEQNQWQLRVVLDDGFSRDYFIDQESGRMVRECDYRAFHPAIDATRVTVETRHEGKMWVDGVLRFTGSKNTNAETGEWLGTSEVRSVEHNVELAEGYFQP